MKRYSLSPEAQDDLDEIRAYLVKKAGRRVAQYVMREIREGIRFVASVPGAGHVREDLTADNVKFWPVFDYLIIYDATKSPIEIVHVYHGNRDVASILEQ